MPRVRPARASAARKLNPKRVLTRTNKSDPDLDESSLGIAKLERLPDQAHEDSGLGPGRSTRGGAHR